VFAGKPVIGVAGGIGSGKSFVARLFGELGCRVIDSDQQVREAYRDPVVRETLRSWWGPRVFLPDGGINRGMIAKKVFGQPAERARLEELLHPWVREARERVMRAGADDAQVLAFVWDTPLLFEASLSGECDAIVFVDAPLEERVTRVARERGWDRAELARRENLQMPLDKKRQFAHYVVQNTADADDARAQVRDVLSRILERPL
jgi:dephospho-CoA kinase